MTSRYAALLVMLALLTACGEVEERGGRKAAADPRPNIIVIITDDHRYDFLGSLQPDVLQTPNLDRLAADGVRFENAFVTTSLCSPARASYLTGLHTHTHGVHRNEVMDIKPETPNIAERLRAAGYLTAFIGKWHMARRSSPRPGFDHWVSFHGQGHYYTNTLNVDGQWELCRNYITDELTDRAVAFLNRPHDKPFLMFLSHKAVHQPFEPAERDTALFVGQPLPRYDVPNDAIKDKSPWKESRRESRGLREMHRYRQTLAAVDEGLGRLLQALEENGELDNTAIIYVGDNGYLMGEHGGLWDKRAPFEPSIRVPMLLRYPPWGKKGHVEDKMVLNLDLAPTLLQLAEVPPDSSLHGRSLLDDGPSRESFLYEYFAHEGLVPTCLAVRSARYKLVYFPLNPELGMELFDLQEDPHETTNLWGASGLAHVGREMQARLEQHLKETEFRWPE